MRTTARLALSLTAAAFLVFVAPTHLEAAGKVTDVAASPSPAVAGQTVTVVVNGSGTCSATVDFGDGPPPANITKLPATLTHVYIAPKTYVLRVFSYREGSEAPGLSNCSGSADTSLTVNPDPRMARKAVGGGSNAQTVAGVRSVGGIAHEHDVVEYKNGEDKAMRRPGALPVIQSVTPSTASAPPHVTVTFAVTASGDCSRSRIDFGDGSTVVEYPIVGRKSQPAPAHAYAKDGTFEVKAYGLADPMAKLPAAPKASDHVCAGHATTSVAVKATMALAPK